MQKYNIGWGLTNLCNMNCKFCYSKISREENKEKELQLEDWINFIDSNHEKIDSINYGTGENVLKDDFFIFIDYIRSKYPNIKQSLTTNGYLFEKVKNNYKYYETYLRCIDEVDVSLDFAEKKKHVEFRGQDHAYDWAISTLKMLKADNKKATIVFVGFNESLEFENIKGLFNIALEYNAYLRMNIYRPTSKIDAVNKRFILDYKRLYDVLGMINQNYTILSLNDVLLGNILTDDNIIDNTGVNSIRILPNGNIYPSTYLISDDYTTGYSILDKNVLENLEFKNFKTSVTPKECKECILREKCNGGVIDRRYLWYNTMEERDPYCPTRYGDSVERKKYKTYKKERISVHDGYLPTLFFENKQ